MKAANMPAQAGGIQLNVRGLMIAVIGLAIVIYVVYSWSNKAKETPQNAAGDLTQFHTWKSMDFVDIPQTVTDLKKSVKINDRRLSFEYENKKGDIFLRETDAVGDAKKGPILLLHGAAFKSQTWLDLGTIAYLSAFGHRVVAIDLPGFGESKSYGSVKDTAGFLAKFIQQERLDRPVIVSPSMSGAYSIPYILGDKPVECTNRIRGYVPVAPTSSESYSHAQWHRCEAPTMIVYGTKDKSLGLVSLGNLRNMPNSEIFPLADAQHPAYLDKPDEWHKNLYNFLLAVEREST